jgi:hypothetical protein
MSRFTEDTLVQQTTAEYMQKLGWESTLTTTRPLAGPPTFAKICWEDEDMSLEGQSIDRKSLRVIRGKTADWFDPGEGPGWRLLIGIEDGEDEPPAGQRGRRYWLRQQRIST